jgi:hypothetical protein
MTTSYILQSQQELRDLKKMERDAESLIQAQAVASAEAKAEASKAWNASKTDRVNGTVPAPVELERARTDAGHFVADDPATPDVNEAYVPKKKAAPKKKSAAKPKAKARSKK